MAWQSEIIHFSHLSSKHVGRHFYFLFSVAPAVWRQQTRSGNLGVAATTKCCTTLRVQRRHNAVDASTYSTGNVLYVAYVHQQVARCIYSVSDCSHRDIQKGSEGEDKRKVKNKEVVFPQVPKLRINKQDLLGCLWHLGSVGRSVSSLIFNKTSQPSNAIPPSVSRY